MMRRLLPLLPIMMLMIPILSWADCNNCSCDNATQACICVDPSMGSGDDRADFGRWSFNVPPPVSTGSNFAIPNTGAPTSSSSELDLDQVDSTPQLEVCLKAASDGSSTGKAYYLMSSDFNNNFDDISPTPNGLTIPAAMEFDGGVSAFESSHQTYSGSAISWIIQGSVNFSMGDLDAIANNLPSEFLLPMTIQLWEESP